MLDHRADLWGVGVVAWELLTGRRLFKAEDDLATLKLVRSLPIDPPSLHNPDVPRELDAIVMTALHRDPAMRWQSASELRTALLAVARPASNGELVEWVDWVYALFSRGERPLRGSRPLTPQKAQCFVVEPPPVASATALGATLLALHSKPVEPAPRRPLPSPLGGRRVSTGHASATIRVMPFERTDARHSWLWMALVLLAVAAASAALVGSLPTG
jgi:serine/threonine protein kinase